MDGAWELEGIFQENVKKNNTQNEALREAEINLPNLCDLMAEEGVGLIDKRQSEKDEDYDDEDDDSLFGTMPRFSVLSMPHIAFAYLRNR